MEAALFQAVSRDAGLQAPSVRPHDSGIQAQTDAAGPVLQAVRAVGRVCHKAVFVDLAARAVAGDVPDVIFPERSAASFAVVRVAVPAASVLGAPVEPRDQYAWEAE